MLPTKPAEFSTSFQSSPRSERGIPYLSLKRVSSAFTACVLVAVSIVASTLLLPSRTALAVGSSGLSREQSSIAQIGTGAGTTGEISSVAVQQDGKILLGGNFTEWKGVATAGLVRLNADYSVDATFFANVATAPTHTAAFYPIRSITPLADGDIWITGEFSSWGGNVAKGLVRLNSDGTFDTAFTAWPSTANTSGKFTALAIQSDGSLIVAIPSGSSWHPSGSSYCKPDSTCTLGRITPQLAKDTSFNTNGGVPNGTVTQIKVQPDNKVVVGGSFSTLSGSGIADSATGRGVVRFNADGTRDTGFNANAAVATLSGTVRGMALQSTGKILATGDFSLTINAVGYTTKLIRFNADGTIDDAFMTTIGGAANGGFRCINSNGCSTVKPFSLSVLSNDSFVVGGFFNGYGGAADANLVGPGLVVLNSDGTLKAGLDRAVNDGNFNASLYSGVKWARSGAHEANTVKNVMAVAVSPTGQIVAGGDFKHWANTGCESGTPTTSATESCETNVGRLVVLNVVNPPTVTSVSPSSGAVAGGTQITISGSDFAQSATVTIGGASCTSVAVVSSTSMTCTTPSGSAGTANVVVTNSVGYSATLSNGFTYVPAPTVSAISPTSGANTGGVSVTITGTGFLAGATVSIGGASCVSVTVVSASSITCTTTSGSSGAATVTVVNSDGQTGSLAGAFSVTTTTTTTPTATTVPPSNSSVGTSSNPAPSLVTSANQAALEAEPGEAVAVINGKKVEVEVVSVPPAATPAQELRIAQNIVATITELLPSGAINTIRAISTPTGAELTGMIVNPDNPSEKLNVPIDSVKLIKAGDNAAVLLTGLNQTNLPATSDAKGALEVTRGGIVAARAFGLPGLETGEIVLMSTPRLLKTFTVSANGTYSGQVPLPTDIGFGSHTVVMATANAKVSLGIKLVRTRMQFRVNKVVSTRLFKNRAKVKAAGGKVTVRAKGRCKANNKRIVMAKKPGGCYITVRQAAKGQYKAIYYRFSVSVVKKAPKIRRAAGKK